MEIRVTTQEELDKALAREDLTYRDDKIIIDSPRGVLLELSDSHGLDVEAHGLSTVRAYGSVRVQAYDSSSVWAYDSAIVLARGSSSVWAYDSAEVGAYDSSNVLVYDFAVIKDTGRW